MGLAYLPDGRRMDYNEYLRTSEWRNKKANRLAFDNWRCAICHKALVGRYETHHINYSRLGHEDEATDLLSLCPECHERFHGMWQKVGFWEKSPLTHWQDFSLEDTAKLCAKYLEQDYAYGGEYNLCNSDVICQFIDRYYQEESVTVPIMICENDVKLFFRNARYEVLFRYAGDRKTLTEAELDEFLDTNFGKKGGKGGNPIRAEARRFFTKHKLTAMHRIYKEEQNINTLCEEVKKLKLKE